MEKKINKTKKMETKKEIILVITSIFLISLVYAVPDFGSIPALPDNFKGNITLYGQSAPIGTLIGVYVAGIQDQTYNLTQTGKYDLYVKTGTLNDIIEFKIQDKIAGNSARQNGETILLNLELLNTPSAPAPSSSSSGSGGGGSSGGGSSIISLSSSSNSENTQSLNNSKNNETNNIKEENKKEEQKNKGFGITGGVIGTLNSKKGIMAVVFFIVIGIGVILIKFKPLQKWTKKFS